jgi:hypothetical protein
VSFGFVGQLGDDDDVLAVSRRFVLRHVGQLGGLENRSISQLGLLVGKPPVFTVSPHIPTLLAFKEMQDAGVSGAAITTDNVARPVILANLSISDLRCSCHWCTKRFAGSKV